MPVTAIAHLCITSTDLKRTSDFYCGVLGLQKKFAFKNGQDKEIGYYLTVGPNNFIEVFARGKDQPAPRAVDHICLQVDKIDAIAESCRARGVAITPKTMGCDGSWQAWLEDPDGVRIELHEYTDKSCQLTGRDCMVNW